MKRNNHGYVLALVMVVTLILCSIASIIASSATNNIKTDVIMFSQEKARYEAEGLVERYYANLKTMESKDRERFQDDGRLNEHTEESITEVLTNFPFDYRTILSGTRGPTDSQKLIENGQDEYFIELNASNQVFATIKVTAKCEVDTEDSDYYFISFESVSIESYRFQ